MNEMNSGRSCLVAQHKPWMRCVRCPPARPTIESHREQESRKKRHSHDCAANGRARSIQHLSEYTFMSVQTTELQVPGHRRREVVRYEVRYEAPGSLTSDLVTSAPETRDLS